MNVEKYQVGKWYATDSALSIQTGLPSGNGFYWILIGNGRHVVIDARKINITSNPQLYGAKLTKYNRLLTIAEASAASKEFVKRLFKEELIKI